VRALQLPNGNLLVPCDPEESDNGSGLVEIGPDDPHYGTWLARSEPGEDPRPKTNRERPAE
jgi:hypothetical protein